MDTRQILSEARDLQQRIVDWRRDIHRHPEIGFEERRTAGVVAEELGRLGLDVRTGVAGTGVVADIDPADPATPGRLLLRADMDALPVQEAEGLDFASETPGVAHLCGHDAHVAMLLGAAEMLVAHRDELAAGVRLMFQPSEERVPGGAIGMIDAGVLDGVDKAFAIHVFTAQNAGQWGLIEGPAMAAVDALEITVTGRGGHAATPEQCIDPVVAASYAVVTLQSIMSRNIRPHDAGVLSLCSIHGGEAFNVIPERVTIIGTLRSHVREMREQVKRRIEEVLDGIARATGTTIELDFTAGYPATINDRTVTGEVRDAVGRLFGPEHAEAIPRKFGGEDFSYVLERVPGMMVYLGVGNEAQKATAAHHSPQFRIDESVLWQGTALEVALAMQHHATS